MALVGIARMAAESELLEAKRAVQYFEIPTRSILNRTKPGMPFQWTINPYRGCEFGCKYCYARYTHEFMELDAFDFEDKIYAKSSTAHLLRQELRRVSRNEGIAIGTATDPYQPAERRFGRTRAILQVFAQERGWHLGVTTKSDLICRDLALLREVARRNVLGIYITVTTLDEHLARLLEPRAPRPALRLDAVRKLADAGIQVGVFPNPVMPGITDGESELDALAATARAAGARTFGGGPLFLMPCAQKVFLPFLEERFPELVQRYRELYAAGAFLGKEYKDALRTRIAAVRARHGLTSEIPDYRPEIAPEEQGSLFEQLTPGVAPGGAGRYNLTSPRNTMHSELSTAAARVK